MNDQKRETNQELDCHVTVNEGSYMTCDMIEEEQAEKDETAEDYHI